MKQVVAIRHVAFESLDGFEEILRNRGYAVRYLEAGYDELDSIDPLAPDLFVILGGPIGVYDQGDFPFISQEVALIRRRVDAGKPILGLCLGAQMIAKALGASVYPGPAKEIGWSPLELTEAGRRSPLGHVGPDHCPVLHWHGDTFDLPEGALLLASTPLYRNQAFSWRGNVLALQFHPEVTVRNLERWFIGAVGEIARTPGLTVTGLREETRRLGPRLEAQGARLFEEWLASCGL